MSRFENDQLVGNSNGELGHHENAKPFKGVPVTLKVLTHVDVQIKETIFLDPATLQAIPTERRHLSAEAIPVHSDKIFAVDPKKAAAGQTKYTFDFNEAHGDEHQRQYFKQVKYFANDQTINDINTALQGLLPLLSPPGQPGGAKFAVMIDGGPIVKVRMVAWKRFDVNSADFEEQVRLFVGEQVNNCNSCCVNTTLPPVSVAAPLTAPMP